jgi:hypothetical protein
MISVSKKINKKSYLEILNLYNNFFIKTCKELKKKKDYRISYPIYYRKVYYFSIYGNSNKKINSFLSPNNVIQISTSIAKNKINYFFPIRLIDIIID